MVVHFHGSSASCTALQFQALFGNRGLSYRSSIGNSGFPNPWEQIYTTAFKPLPADIGAISVSEIVGIPLPWPQSTAPSGWLKCNGQSFNTSTYPKLAQVYPGGVLPDLRGEFIRGWDDGRGVDAGRGIGTSQGDAIRDITGSMVGYNIGMTSGAFVTDTGTSAPFSAASGPNGFYYKYFRASAVVPTASENRPRNVAFNYIVRAA
ncbi:hypothetical protein Dpoa569_0001364 [Dickeya poaceiphila]|uniref:Phage tail collar domain-containing protein n=2 Tax=Dickeya poaceiphila TaxID=568768 RepID=A0A5B8HSJ2_9GAMM|nr:hypothetical protein Dpoa569_0001364 [Dickeya poaceiphila]